ncbi:MAG: trypsin-like peptidase domain-containing protein [Limnochordaceae bacterium]|nr:trypsin-like peptidase domain-containing protein [Limnochordaceae bacterium]
MQKWSRIWHSRLAMLVAVTLVAFLAGGVAVSLGWIPSVLDRAATESSQNPVADANVSPAVAGRPDTGIGGGVPMTQYTVADVADHISPSVAYIEVQFAYAQAGSRRGPGRLGPYSDPFNSFWQYFFGFPGPGPQPGTGPDGELPPSVGSGVVVSADGYILTNQHVVDVPAGLKLSKIQVTVPGVDGKMDAELVGSDRNLDLAVLKVKTSQRLPVAPLGNSDGVRVGEWVVAIGNPFELDHTVTVGVISAKDRQIQIPDQQSGTIRTYEHLMQTDAAINPGNSGGPLVNLRGEVIGINTAVLDSSQGQGIGFAIPINAAKAMVNQVTSTGKFVAPWIGIGYGSLDDTARQYFGIDSSVTGVVVGEVYPNSPAAKAGLQAGDVIIEVNRQKVTDQDSFGKAIADMKVGDRLAFLVMRNGQTRVITVVVGERPPQY